MPDMLDRKHGAIAESVRKRLGLSVSDQLRKLWREVLQIKATLAFDRRDFKGFWVDACGKTLIKSVDRVYPNAEGFIGLWSPTRTVRLLKNPWKDNHRISLDVTFPTDGVGENVKFPVKWKKCCHSLETGIDVTCKEEGATTKLTFQAILDKLCIDPATGMPFPPGSPCSYICDCLGYHISANPEPWFEIPCCCDDYEIKENTTIEMCQQVIDPDALTMAKATMIDENCDETEGYIPMVSPGADVTNECPECPDCTPSP